MGKTLCKWKQLCCARLWLATAILFSSKWLRTTNTMIQWWITLPLSLINHLEVYFISNQESCFDFPSSILSHSLSSFSFSLLSLSSVSLQILSLFIFLFLYLSFSVSDCLSISFFLPLSLYLSRSLSLSVSLSHTHKHTRTHTHTLSHYLCCMFYVHYKCS